MAGVENGELAAMAAAELAEARGWAAGSTVAAAVAMFGPGRVVPTVAHCYLGSSRAGQHRRLRRRFNALVSCGRLEARRPSHWFVTGSARPVHFSLWLLPGAGSLRSPRIASSARRLLWGPGEAESLLS